MALTNGTLFDIRASATTGNVNGAGFNPNNANFPTDATTDSNTANTAAPVLSSATYSFVAGDVGAWVYIKSGTNWTPGFYQIASVASNKATLNATIGAAIQLNTGSGFYEPNTVVGCATVGTPTSGTFGVNYAMQDTAQATATNYAAVGASTTLTSASANFTRMMVGNFYHQTTTGTGGFGVVGWYEIVSYTNSSTVVLDRTPNSGTASVACTGFVGGSGRLNGLEDAFFEMIPGASMVYIKNGTYVLSASVSIASSNSSAASPSTTIGYNSIWGDTCVGNNRPLISQGGSSWSWGVYQSSRNLIHNGTSATVVTMNTYNTIINCKYINTSTTASRNAASISNAGSNAIYCEFTSQSGQGVRTDTNSTSLLGCYIHDCVLGVGGSSTNMVISGCVFESNTTAATYTSALPNTNFHDNTVYGTEVPSGTGLSFTAANATSSRVTNNIFYGLSTAISVATGPSSGNFGANNNYFNNTTDRVNWYTGAGSLSLNPTFVSVSQITGTAATTSGSVLTDGAADFSAVTDNVDYLHVVSGTGTTLGIYLITGHTTTTLTVNNALGTDGTADKVYFITIGHNFQVGSNMSAVGFPTFANTGLASISYPDVGAFQRQPTVGGARSYTFVG